MGQIHVDDMTLEILCTDCGIFRPKSVGAVSKSVFYKTCPAGGARGGPCEVVIWQPRSVCVQNLVSIGPTVTELIVLDVTDRRTDRWTDRRRMFS